MLMKRVLTLLVGVGSLAVASADSFVKSTYTGSNGLNDLAKARGKYMGTATNLEPSDSFYTAALKNTKDFGMYTPANAMKWDSLEPQQNVFKYTAADQLVAIAKSTGAKVRCHTLVWHQQIPTWVQNLGKADLLKALSNHITKVMTHFGDSCYAWDVVNEVIGDDAQYRKSFWYTKTGTEYISTAFKTASAVKKQLGLKVKLYYNDYNTNTVNAKSTAGYNMVKWLQSQGIEINGVGFQSHLTVGVPASTADQVKNFNRFTALGLDVAITELDVNTKTTTPTTAQQTEQVTLYQNTIAACKQVTKCVGVTIWDFVDTYTWISNSAPLPWYQPSGKNTKLVRKSSYDGIVRGWST